MLTDLVIENFQSVKSAHFRLGRFTVITGPTDSGKSGMLRALRLAAFNQRGTGFIRQGAATCKAGFGSQDEGWFLAIERGGRGKDLYRVARGIEQHIHDDDGTVEGCPGCFADPVVQTFTKLAGEAPPEVLQVHRLGKLNFAGQLDFPFLLDSSGAEVARILGELTNVSLVYEAAREGARRRQRLSAALSATEAQVASLTQQLQGYAVLPAQVAAQERAEQALARAHKAAEVVSRLELCITAAELNGTRADIAAREAAAAAPPSLAAVELLLSRCQRLAGAAAEFQAAREEAVRQHHFIEVARVREQEAHQAVHAALEDLGVCPTCEQPISAAPAGQG